MAGPEMFLFIYKVGNGVTLTIIILFYTFAICPLPSNTALRFRGTGQGLIELIFQQMQIYAGLC